MATKIFLDDIDITADLAAQYALPATNTAGVYPDRTRSTWWDLLPAINNHVELRESFFNDSTGVHSLTFQDTQGEPVIVKVLMRTKYTSRNR